MTDCWDMPWIGEAACRGHANAHWWFSKEAADIKRAKAICQNCPVLDPCRRHGMDNERYGTWGGLTDEERQRIRRRDGLGVLTVKPVALTAEQRLTRLGHGRGAYRAGLCRCNDCLGAHNAYGRMYDHRRRQPRHDNSCACNECAGVRARQADAAR